MTNQLKPKTVRLAGPQSTAAALPPPASLDDLLRRAAATAQKSRSPITERSYSSLLRSFAKFAAVQGKAAFPARAHTIAAFLQYRIDAGASPVYLELTLTALRHAHHAAKQPDPTDDPHIRAISQGYRRSRAACGEVSKQTRGLSESDLAAIIATARADGGIRAVRDIAIIALLREGLLRCGECAALRVRDFRCKKDGSGRLFVSRSKTDQEGQGCVLFLGKQAATAVTAWLDAAPANGDAPLFRHVLRGGYVQSSGLKNKSVSGIVRKRGEAAGICGLSGHSGRVGMAQDLVAFGASIAEVAIAGRWKSPEQVIHYASRQELAKGAIAKYHRNRV